MGRGEERRGDREEMRGEERRREMGRGEEWRGEGRWEEERRGEEREGGRGSLFLPEYTNDGERFDDSCKRVWRRKRHKPLIPRIIRNKQLAELSTETHSHPPTHTHTSL